MNSRDAFGPNLGDSSQPARVYHPTLVERLIGAEAAKGGPLESPEVAAIVAEAVPIETVASHARMLEERRGYRDIDPANAWDDWQAFRDELAEAGG